jgi:hypothetical protein
MRTGVLFKTCQQGRFEGNQTRKNCVFNSGYVYGSLVEAMETCFSAQTGTNCIQEEKVVERKKKN